MKQFLLSLVAVCTAGVAQAQQAVPQGGLENWVIRNGVLAPTGWLNTDDLLVAAGFPFVTGTVTRSGTARSGSYAAQLATSNAPLLGKVPGLLIIGSRLDLGAEFPGGVPYTGRPARLEFYYKLSGAGVANDSAAVQVALTRTVAGKAQMVAEGVKLLLTPASAYTLVTVPLQYQSSAPPDSLRLLFSSGNADNLTVGTTLTVDDVVFTGTATATRDAVADAALSVYPTSSPDGRFTLAAPDQPALLRGALRVSDATGRVVRTQPAVAPASTRVVDLRGLAPGLYVLRLETEAGPLSRKLLVQ